jgi:acetyltransferase
MHFLTKCLTNKMGIEGVPNYPLTYRRYVEGWHNAGFIARLSRIIKYQIMSTPDSTILVNKDYWDTLFNADSIAVIGAKDTIGSWGLDAMRAALGSAKANGRRRVYAVNPNLREVLGGKSYSSVLDITTPVELAIIVVPADIVPSVMRQCVQKGVKAAVIVSAGFAEVDEDGARLQTEVVDIARKGGLRFVGPNCTGHADMHTRLDSAGVVGRIPAGPMALVSQSGMLGASIMQTAANRGIGLSKLVSTGNEADLHLEDYLEYLAGDKDTRIIAAYVEGLREGNRFLQLARKITPEKPIVVMKSGATSQSAIAARSHTGALAGSDEIYTAAFKQTGVIRAEDEAELCDIVLALLNQPLPRGDRVAVLTMGGGFGVITAEACEKEGLKLASLEPHTMERLNEILPPRWSHSNPIDLVGIRPSGGDATVLSCLCILLQDKNVDCIISLLPLTVTVHGGISDLTKEQFQAMQRENEKNLRILNKEQKKHDKPLVFINRISFQPAHELEDSPSESKVRLLEFSRPRRAARVIRSLVWYHQYLEDRKT